MPVSVSIENAYMVISEQSLIFTRQSFEELFANNSSEIHLVNIINLFITALGRINCS